MTTNIVPVPTLSLDGWVYSTVSKADYLMAHFLESEKSQTALYGASVSSLQFIIQDKQSSITDCCIAIRDTLGSYFSSYFDNVKVDTSYKNASPNSSMVIIDISLSFTGPDGKEFLLTRLVDLLDSKIQRVRILNNTGPVI